MHDTEKYKNEMNLVRITQEEIGAISFVLSWLRGKPLRDDLLPVAIEKAEAFASRAIEDANTQNK